MHFKPNYGSIRPVWSHKENVFFEMSNKMNFLLLIILIASQFIYNLYLRQMNTGPN